MDAVFGGDFEMDNLACSALSGVSTWLTKVLTAQSLLTYKINRQTCIVESRLNGY